MPGTRTTISSLSFRKTCGTRALPIPRGVPVSSNSVRSGGDLVELHGSCLSSRDTVDRASAFAPLKSMRLKRSREADCPSRSGSSGGSYDHGAGGRQLIEVAEALKAISAGAVQEVMRGIRRLKMAGLPRIRADGFRTEADDASVVNQPPNFVVLRRSRCRQGPAP